jgi:hypothetical protein
MNKLIISIPMLGLITQGLTAVPEPRQIVEQTLQECMDKINILQQNPDVKNLDVKDKTALIDWLFPYICLADMMKASNAEQVVTMPYARYICPQDQREYLREKNISIGNIDTERLNAIVSPIDKSYLRWISRGFMQTEETKTWKVAACCTADDDAKRLEKFHAYYPKMGFLAEVYLEACERPGILPVMPEETVTVAYPMDILPCKIDDETGELVPNEEFFIKWKGRIYALAIDTSIVQALIPISRFIATFVKPLEAMQSKLSPDIPLGSENIQIMRNMCDLLQQLDQRIKGGPFSNILLFAKR